MNEPMLIFETDPQCGTPRLRPLRGAALTWSDKERSLLEEQLRPRYDGLVRDGEGTIAFNGRMLYVKKREDDISRQPTLELWLIESSACRSAEKPFALPKPAAPAVSWGKGFVAEIDRLFASDNFNRILAVEKAMLNLVREELKALLNRTAPADSALLVLVSVLMLAENVSRTDRPNEPHPYAYALSGIERLMSETGATPQTPWGELPVKPACEPPPSWLGRFWSRLTGA